MVTYYKRILAELPKRRRPPVRIPARARVEGFSPLSLARPSVGPLSWFEAGLLKARRRLAEFVALVRGR